VEDEPDAVLVTVRDDGPGIAEGRLEAAAAEGRLGVAQSIRGRLRDLGGGVELFSVPGQGTEVELRLPKPPATGGGAGAATGERTKGPERLPGSDRRPDADPGPGVVVGSGPGVVPARPVASAVRAEPAGADAGRNEGGPTP
jgi:hypothetical protein